MGRRAELAELARLLDQPDTRLVTILAPGGMGKTRLALVAAERQLRRFSDGVFFVPLAPLKSPDLIASIVAENVGLHLYGSEAYDRQLIAYLRDRNMLLILDNIEHLLDGVGLVTDILKNAPLVKVLVTSREKIKHSGEKVVTLSGLQFSHGEIAEAVLAEDAVQLFMQSAQHMRPDFTLQPEDIDSILRICRLTAGMPLALVLAAGWVDVLSLQQIAAELQQGFDILETEMRDMPDRHQSVRASFNATWARLDESEREVFMKLSVFRGGFTAEAAQAVAGASTRQLRKLVDKALLQALAAERYDIHELLRQYGEAQLEAAGQGDLLRDAHSQHYGAFFYARRSEQFGPGKAELLRLFTAELDNIRAAWTWALQSSHFEFIDQLVELLWMYYTDYSEAFELGAMCQAATGVLSGSTDKKDRARLGRVLARQGKWAATRALFEQAESCFRQSMAIAREQGDEVEYYYAQRWLARYVLFSTDAELSPVRLMLEECAAFYRERGDKGTLALTLTNLASLWKRVGDIEQMRACALEYHRLNSEMGYSQGIAEAYTFLAEVAMEEGNYVEAEQCYSKSVELYKNTAFGSRRGLMLNQCFLGYAVLMLGVSAARQRLMRSGTCPATNP